MNTTNIAHYSSLHEAAVILKSLSKPQAAGILSRLKPGDMRQVLDAVNELDGVTAEQLDELTGKLAASMSESLATMDDLLQLNEEQMQALLRTVNTSYWAPALKKSSVKIQRAVFEQLAERPKEILSREMAELHDLDPRVEQFARREIVAAMVDLK